MASRKARRSTGRTRYRAGGSGPPVRSFGAYATNEPYPDLSAHYALEGLLGRPLKIMSWFTAWSWDTFLSTQGVEAKNGGYTILYCWEATAVPFSEIVAGTRDSAITTWMTNAKNTEADIALRLFHEMNGNWYDWAVGDSDSYVTSTAQWISAWQRIVGIRNTVGATNVKMVFCANSNDTSAYPMESYYPGDAYVDIMGIDGYAFGTGTTFASVYQDMYDRMRVLAPTKTDFLIGEIGTDANVLSGAQDTAWWTSFYDNTSMPLLDRICFFHENQFKLDVVPDTLALHKSRMGDTLTITPLADLTDNFSGTLTKWPTLYGSTTAITGGRLRLSTDAGYTGARSAAIYTLAGSQVHARVYAPAAGGATLEANLGLRLESGTDGTYIGIEVNRATGNISFQNSASYTDANVVQITYDATAHAWWRVREATGVLFWETSPDKTTWTNRRTTNTATPAWASSSNTIAVQFTAHRNNGTNDFAEIDDVNV